jgi:hypothetical protein
MPELTESIESINNQLINLYGIDTITGQPMFRVVFSDTQTEKRLTPCDDRGNELLHPEVRELPKYQWIKGKYILEQLVGIPEVNMPELPTSKMSYEPLYVFEGNLGKYLPPRLDVAKILIDTMYAALGKESLAKYLQGTEEELIQRQKELDEVQEYLYGDESSLLGDTVDESGSTIIVPRVWMGES